MATAKRDYYDVLGLARGARDREIRSAFRRLARELHPDVSDHPEAQERFREAAEAYEVLSKSETRGLYDRFGHEGLRTGGFRPTDFDFGSLTDLFATFFGDDLFGGLGGRPGRRSARGADVLAEVEIELAEAAAGVRRSVPFPVVVGCATCQGTGAAAGTALTTCPTCDGFGRVQSVTNSVFGRFVRMQGCPRCGGSGQVVETPCEDCTGTGRVTEQRELEVDVPPGIHDGQRIRLSGEGHAGALGGRAGDVYVQIHVRPDERFVRDGNDVVSSVDLTVTHAALGATVAVATLDGDLELFPEGFEERDLDEPVELAGYTGRVDATALLESLGSVTESPIVAGWEDAWKRFHHPIRIGPLWIGPPWEAPGDGATAVVVEPGRAFGTGAHPTTRLCLAPVFALDEDDAAVAATRANAAANAVEVDAQVADVLSDPLPPVEVAVANIAREPVERAAERFGGRLFVASGYLAAERPEPVGWQAAERREAEGWAADLLRRV